MCNLSEWIEEEALERGKAEGKAELILAMRRKGYTAGQIADMTDRPVEEIIEIIEKNEPLLV